ncbi:MAG: hypothetical protein WCK96_11630 [Methylococcales bacterium]
MNDESNENEQNMEKSTDIDDNKIMIGVFIVGVLMVIWGADMPSKPSSDDGWFLYFVQSFAQKLWIYFWIFWNRYLGIILVLFSLDRIFLKGWILENINIIWSKFSKPKIEEAE